MKYKSKCIWRYLLIAACLTMICFGAVADDHTVTIDMDDHLREIDGFGACSAWYTQRYMEMPPENGDRMIEAFFDPEDGLGLSIYRCFIRPNVDDESTSHPYFNWEDSKRVAEGVFARLVQDRYDPFIFTSEWSPPAWMKSNKSVKKGGYLLEEYYDDYALYQATWIKGMRDEFGVNIDALSFQNEPGVKKWQSCEWTTDQIKTYLREHLIPTLIDQGLMSEDGKTGLKLIVNEETAWRDHQLNALLKEPGIEPYIDIAGAHSYGTNFPERTFDFAREKGKRVWQTEFYNKGNEGHKSDTIGYGLLIGRIMHNFMVNNDVNTYMYWWMASPENKDSQSLIDMIDDNKDFAIMKQGYAVGHFARFIRPGWFRIAVDNPFPDLGKGITSPAKDARLGVSAFASHEKSQMAIIVINDTDAEQSFTLKIKNAPKNLEQLSVWRTSESEGLDKCGELSVKDATAVLKMPPFSMATVATE